MPIGTPSNIGSATGTTQVSSGSFTTTANIPAGALVIVEVSRQNINAISDVTSVTDGTNTYSSAIFKGDPGQNCGGSVWYTAGATAVGSGATITVNGFNLLSSGPSWGISAWIVSGIATTSVLDGTPGTGTSNATTWSTTSVTTTNANDLAWILYVSNAEEPAAIVNADCTPTSGWTLADSMTFASSNASSLRSAYQIMSATGSFVGGGTQTAVLAGAWMIVAFKGLAGGGAAAAPPGINQHGQWPNPLRYCQRPALSWRAHNQPLNDGVYGMSNGVNENDTVWGQLEEFYGGGTQTGVMKFYLNSKTDWPFNARDSLRTSMLRQPQNNGLPTEASLTPGAGVNANDETVDNEVQFFGQMWRPASFPVQIVCTFSGNGSLPAPVGVEVNINPALTLNGTAALTPGVEVNINPAPTLNGTGALTPGVEVNINPALTLNGTGALTPGVEVNINPAPTLNGVGSLTPGVEVGINPAPTFLGQGSLTPGVEVNINPAPTLNGTGSLNGTPEVNINPSTILNGTGSLTDQPVTGLSNVPLNGTGSLNVTVQVGQLVIAPIFNGTGGMIVAVTVGINPALTMAAVGSLGVVVEETINPAPLMSGTGSLSAAVTVPHAVFLPVGSSIISDPGTLDGSIISDASPNDTTTLGGAPIGSSTD